MNFPIKVPLRTLRSITSLVIALITLSSVSSPARSNPDLQELRTRIEQMISSSGAEVVSLAFCDLSSGTELLINPDVVFHAASTMKVPVMIEVFRQASAGKFSLDDQLVLKNHFKSIVDGSTYSLSPADDSDQSLYARTGGKATIRELVHFMITVSSNLATNILIERVGPERVMTDIQRLGVKSMKVLRGVEDGKAFEKGLNNTTNARDLMVLLRAIGQKRAGSAADCDEMIKVLLDQKFNEGIPASLPAGVRVAHKTGSITKIYHDAGIIYAPDRPPYVLVVLTRGFADEQKAHDLVSAISKLVYTAVTPSH